MIVSPDFLTHWKTQMLIDALGEASPLYLIRLWAHCQQRKSTRFESMSSAALKALCRASCEAIELERVLTESGFIIRDGGAVSVPKWEEYNSSLVAAWENGKKGGRPKKEPEQNPRQTQRLTQENPAVTHGQPSGEPIREEKIREDKKGQEQEKSSPRVEKTARGSRLPKDWIMSDAQESFCKQERPSLDPSTVACRFRDYWHAAAGKSGVKLDWDATWRNWVRNEREPTQAKAQQLSFRERDEQAAIKRWEEMTGRVHPDRVKSGDVIEMDFSSKRFLELDDDYSQGD